MRNVRVFYGHLPRRRPAFGWAVRLADIRADPSQPSCNQACLVMRSDKGKCLACHWCERACPTGCLYIEEEPAQIQDREKRPRVVEIDLARCLFCGQCVDSCPEGAIALVARNRLSGDLSWNMVRGEYVNS